MNLPNNVQSRRSRPNVWPSVSGIPIMLFASLRGGRGQGISVVTTGNVASAYGLQVLFHTSPDFKTDRSKKNW